MSTNPTRDRASVLAALRPGSAQEQGWDEPAREAVRLRILNSDPQRVTRVSSASPGAVRSRSTHRRRAASLAAVGTLLVGGGGVAVAGGHLLAAFTQAFAGWAGDWSANGVDGVSPDTAQRVASAAGPDGTTFTVMSASTTTTNGSVGVEGGACTVVVLETAASARQAGPSQFQDVSDNGCLPSVAGQPFGAAATGSVARAEDSTLGVEQDALVWSAAAGAAVRAQVVTADGRTWPAVSHDGVFYGWYPILREVEAPAVLIGFDADGTEVGRTLV